MKSDKTLRLLALLLVCLFAVWPIAAQENQTESAADEETAETTEEAPVPTLYETTTEDAPKGQRQPLAHKWAHGALMGCSVENALAMIDAIDGFAPNAMDLSALRESLMADRDALANAETREDLKAARDAAKDNLAAAKAAVQDLRRKGAQLDKAARKSLRDAKEEIKMGFQTCKQQMMRDTGKERSDAADAAEAKWSAVADKLEGKGADVSALRAIIAELKNAAAPLKAAVESGDVDAIKAAVKELRMQHLHLWARFHIARVQIGVDHAKDNGADVSAAQAKLDEASALAAPGKAYGEGEHKQVHALLKEAASLMRDALKASRESSTEEVSNE